MEQTRELKIAVTAVVVVVVVVVQAKAMLCRH